MTKRPLAHQLVHGTLWSLVSRVLGVGAILLSTALLARILSTAEMGIFFLAASLVNVAKAIGQYGLPRVTIRKISEALALHDHGYAARVGLDLVVFGLLFMLVTSLLMWLFVLPALPSFIGMTTRIAEMKDYVIVWVAASVVIALSSAVLRGFHDNQAASLVGASLAPVLVAAGYVLMFFMSTGDTLKIAIVLTAGMHVIAAVAALALLKKPLWNYRLRENPVHTRLLGWKEIMAGATPFWINSVALLGLSSAGLWVLSAYHAESDVAIYGAAMKLIAVAVGMVGIVQPVLLPAISDSYTRQDHVRLGRALRTAGLVTGLPTIVICATFIVFPGLWMGLVFGPAYLEGANVLAALSAGYLAAAFIGLPGVALGMTDAQKQFMFATLVTGTITLVAILLVTEDHGAFWLAVVVSTGLVCQRLVFWAMLRRHVQVRSDLFAASLKDLKSAMNLVVRMLLRRGSGRDYPP